MFARVPLAALCTSNYRFAYGMRTIVDYLCHSTSGYARMMISHSIVAPQVPWGVKNKLLMQSVPDPSSLGKGAGTQTTILPLI